MNRRCVKAKEGGVERRPFRVQGAKVEQAAHAVAVGAQYLPFAFHYGMRMFISLSGILVATGVAIEYRMPADGPLAGWLTAGTMIVFAFFWATWRRWHPPGQVPYRATHSPRRVLQQATDILELLKWFGCGYFETTHKRHRISELNTN